MDELSLHILDIVHNSIEASAKMVEIEIFESTAGDLVSIRIVDNGRGIDPNVLRQVLGPFVTSRTSRRVGLGLSLLSANAEACNGRVSVESAPGHGTAVTATFQASHIDRQPLGDMRSTLMVLVACAPAIVFHYRHEKNGRVFEFNTSDIRDELGDVPITHPAVIRWLDEFIGNGLRLLDVPTPSQQVPRRSEATSKEADKHAETEVA